MIYRLLMLGAGGRLAAVRKISALDDEEALLEVHALLIGSEGITGFELWQASRRVQVPETRKAPPRPPREGKPRRRASRRRPR